MTPFILLSGPCLVPSGPCLVDRPFFVFCVVRDLSCVVQDSAVLFVVVVGAGFACRLGVFVSLTGPVRALSRLRFSAALAVLFLPLWHARLGSVHYL